MDHRLTDLGFDHRKQVTNRGTQPGRSPIVTQNDIEGKNPYDRQPLIRIETSGRRGQLQRSTLRCHQGGHRQISITSHDPFGPNDVRINEIRMVERGLGNVSSRTRDDNRDRGQPSVTPPSTSATRGGDSSGSNCRRLNRAVAELQCLLVQRFWTPIQPPRVQVDRSNRNR